MLQDRSFSVQHAPSADKQRAFKRWDPTIIYNCESGWEPVSWHVDFGLQFSAAAGTKIAAILPTGSCHPHIPFIICCATHLDSCLPQQMKEKSRQPSGRGKQELPCLLLHLGDETSTCQQATLSFWYILPFGCWVSKVSDCLFLQNKFLFWRPVLQMASQDSHLSFGENFSSIF